MIEQLNREAVAAALYVISDALEKTERDLRAFSPTSVEDSRCDAEVIAERVHVLNRWLVDVAANAGART